VNSRPFAGHSLLLRPPRSRPRPARPAQFPNPPIIRRIGGCFHDRARTARRTALTEGRRATIPGRPRMILGPPTTTFGPPKMIFGPPTTIVGPPTKTFGTPKTVFGPSTTTAGPPKMTEGAPKTPARPTSSALRDNVMPLSGRGGARATPDREQSIPPPRSAPMAGYAARRRRKRLDRFVACRTRAMNDSRR
jgi:hypothetical protein